MYSEKYKTKTGRILHRPVLESGEMPNDFDLTGFCLACGSDQSGVEPDARRYTCEACGETMVYGMEELVIMGVLKLSEDYE